MEIHGLQKLTLLDYPGHLACTVFVGGCNMRCPFCHNYELATKESRMIMTNKHFMSFLKQQRGKLEAVVISGGEPCLNNWLPTFIREIKNLGFKVKLDTNGTRPDVLNRLLMWNMVDYVAMDVKNSPTKYAMTVGLPKIDLMPIKESIRILKESKIDYEFRTTVVNELHDEGDFFAIGTLIEGARRYFLQPFKDSPSVPFDGFHAPDYDTMKRYAHIAAGSVEEVRIRGM